MCADCYCCSSQLHRHQTKRHPTDSKALLHHQNQFVTSVALLGEATGPLLLIESSCGCRRRQAVRPIALKRLNPFRYVGNQPFLHTPQTRGKTRSARSTRPAHDTDCTRDRAQTLYESAEASKAVGSRLPWLVITVYRNSSGIKEWDTRRTRRAYTIALLGLLISPPAFNSTNQRCRRSNLVTVAWLPIWCNWTTQYCEQHGRPQGNSQQTPHSI